MREKWRLFNDQLFKGAYRQKKNLKNNSCRETYFVAVDTNNPVIDVFQKKGLYTPIFLSLHIFQIIGVNNTNHSLEFSCPSSSMMVPCKMLRLLKDSNVCHIIRNGFSNITNR